jgi:hypothetical protein
METGALFVVLKRPGSEADLPLFTYSFMVK